MEYLSIREYLRYLDQAPPERPGHVVLPVQELPQNIPSEDELPSNLESVISCAVCASSTDHPDQGIRNTLSR